MTERDATDLVWKALADEKRRRVLDLLASGARTTGDLCAHFAEPAHGGLGRT
ncbi:MAG: DNA-binding transcriptional ArsR family regulator, partial [Chlamydiales bacterium]